MNDSYLEVTYRHGKPLAAYYYLPRMRSDRCVRSKSLAPGLIVDYAENDKAIGLEITAPSVVALDSINAVLAKLGLESVSPSDLAPLHAA